MNNKYNPESAINSNYKQDNKTKHSTEIIKDSVLSDLIQLSINQNKQIEKQKLDAKLKRVNKLQRDIVEI